MSIDFVRSALLAAFSIALSVPSFATDIVPVRVCDVASARRVLLPPTFSGDYMLFKPRVQISRDAYGEIYISNLWGEDQLWKIDFTHEALPGHQCVNVTDTDRDEGEKVVSFQAFFMNDSSKGSAYSSRKFQLLTSSDDQVWGRSVGRGLMPLFSPAPEWQPLQ